MGMIITSEQRQIFDDGATFSFDLFGVYVQRHWKKECKTIEEKREFFFDIWNLIESFQGNISYYQIIDTVVKEKNISEDDRYFFEEGISEHNRYVKFCLQNDDVKTVDVHFKEYLEGKITALPNKFYASFKEFADA
jgi:hypothetical protein